jgi:SAM-dependent methyltransferase
MDLASAVTWRRWLWLRPTDWAIADRQQFCGKRLLEIGCRTGEMSAFFSGLGCEVDGVDIDATAIDRARDRFPGINFSVCRDLSSLSKKYDYVFTKSVLVILGDPGAAVRTLAGLLNASGQYIAVENRKGIGVTLSCLFRRGHRRSLGSEFHPVDGRTLEALRDHFATVATFTQYGMVTAIRAQYPTHQNATPAIANQANLVHA